jgi:CBS domain containing-hemolysin-like protein
MPVSGDEFEVDNVSFSVVSTVGRRIKKVRVVKHPPGAPNGNGQIDVGSG